MPADVQLTTRAPSPTRVEAIAKALRPGPVYNNGVLIGNWVEERIECPKGGSLYFSKVTPVDVEGKYKYENRQLDMKENKFNATLGNVVMILNHNCEDNFTTTNDLVYRIQPQPLCGPEMRYYARAKHQFYPQPDLMKCAGNQTSWGLREMLQEEWRGSSAICYDYNLSTSEDVYRPPGPCDYTRNRFYRDTRFTKSFKKMY